MVAISAIMVTFSRRDGFRLGRQENSMKSITLNRTTLDIYTRAVSQQKWDANPRIVEMMLPLEMKNFEPFRILGRIESDGVNSGEGDVGLIGIEPMTSSLQSLKLHDINRNETGENTQTQDLGLIYTRTIRQEVPETARGGGFEGIIGQECLRKYLVSRVG
jgi:hypothetical protein